ncbi:MAG: hypothetical protein ACE14S_07045 [Candidatus Bathyarchaeia archaeon]
MVDLITVHSMLVELHGGMLTLAAVCILATVASRGHLRMRRTSESYGVFWAADSFMGTLGRYAEPTAYLAGIGAVIGLILSAVVGFYIWPIEFLTNSPLGLSKVMFSVFATELMFVFVFIRSKYGENLWRNRGTAAVYACLGIFGFLLMMLAGSLGGHMAGKGSILDPIYALVGINPESFGFLGLNYAVVLVGFSVVAIAVPTAAFMYLQKRTVSEPAAA